MIKENIFYVCRIYVEDLLAKGVENGAVELKPLKYRVVRADQSYCGEIDVGITFTREVTFLHLMACKCKDMHVANATKKKTYFKCICKWQASYYNTPTITKF